MEVRKTNRSHTVISSADTSTGIVAEKAIRFYRPLTPVQLAGLVRNDCLAFCPEAHSNEFSFYIKLSRKYAEMVARQWNAPHYSAGYVVQFDLPYEFVRDYEMESIAYEEHLEYCVPVQELARLNAHLHGQVEIVAAYVSPRHCQQNRQESVESMLELMFE